MGKKLLRDYMLKFVGLPYRWGGDDTMEGYDCSGFVQEILRSMGKDPDGDQTANDLYNHFKFIGDEKNYVSLGDLVFFGTHEKITHVAIGIAENTIIEASGGNITTTSIARAIKQNAFVRVRPVDYRSDLVAIIDPLY